MSDISEEAFQAGRKMADKLANAYDSFGRDLLVRKVLEAAIPHIRAQIYGELGLVESKTVPLVRYSPEGEREILGQATVSADEKGLIVNATMNEAGVGILHQDGGYSFGPRDEEMEIAPISTPKFPVPSETEPWYAKHLPSENEFKAHIPKIPAGEDRHA